MTVGQTLIDSNLTEDEMSYLLGPHHPQTSIAREEHLHLRISDDEDWVGLGSSKWAT